MCTSWFTRRYSLKHFDYGLKGQVHDLVNFNFFYSYNSLVTREWHSNFSCILKMPFWSIVKIKIGKMNFDQNRDQKKKKKKWKDGNKLNKHNMSLWRKYFKDWIEDDLRKVRLCMSRIRFFLYFDLNTVLMFCETLVIDIISECVLTCEIFSLSDLVNGFC